MYFFQACKGFPLYLRVSNKCWGWVPCKDSVCSVCVCVCVSPYISCSKCFLQCVCGVG